MCSVIGRRRRKRATGGGSTPWRSACPTVLLARPSTALPSFAPLRLTHQVAWQARSSRGGTGTHRVAGLSAQIPGTAVHHTWHTHTHTHIHGTHTTHARKLTRVRRDCSQRSLFEPNPNVGGPPVTDSRLPEELQPASTGGRYARVIVKRRTGMKRSPRVSLADY